MLDCCDTERQANANNVLNVIRFFGQQNEQQNSAFYWVSTHFYAGWWYIDCVFSCFFSSYWNQSDQNAEERGETHDSSDNLFREFIYFTLRGNEFSQTRCTTQRIILGKSSGSNVKCSRQTILHANLILTAEITYTHTFTYKDKHKHDKKCWLFCFTLIKMKCLFVWYQKYLCMHVQKGQVHVGASIASSMQLFNCI